MENLEHDQDATRSTNPKDYRNGRREQTRMERERIQEALREGEDRLQAVLDDSPVAIFLKDPRGRYLMVNRHYEIALRATRG